MHLPARQSNLSIRRGDVMVAVLVTAVLAAGFAILSRWKPAQSAFSPIYADFNAVSAGWSESQVRAFLGTPAHEFRVDSISQGWKVPGYSMPQRGVTGAVLIYIRSDVICYCFLDRKGLVEEIFIGGS